jgi:DNA-binding NtrC family response regulator
VPPLRERRADIVPLARHFLWEAGCAEPETVLTPQVIERLTARTWPGNVRELRSALQRAVLLSEDDAGASLAEPEEQNLDVGPASPATDELEALLARLLAEPYRQAKEELLDAFDRFYAQRLHDDHQGNISAMARDAGVDRQVIRRLMQRIEP